MTMDFRFPAPREVDREIYTHSPDIDSIHNLLWFPAPTEVDR